ncbi:hypothetical protein ACQKWADRAFT_286178 [Trichoderma austrokoningii]
MNKIPAEAIASSVPFRFMVGPNRREFTIHSALLSHQSPVLDKLVNGSFSEAADKCVTWDSVDEDTFIRFWQYAYTGKYAVDLSITGLESGPQASQEAEKRTAQEAIEAATVAKEEKEIVQLVVKRDNTLRGLSAKDERRLIELQAKAARRAAREAERRAEIAEEEEELAELLRMRDRRPVLAAEDRERLIYLLDRQVTRRREGQVASEAESETPSGELTIREAQWNSFKLKGASGSSGGTSSSSSNGPKKGTSARSNQAHEDYTSTFLSHARLFVFAECYGITGLMDLSLAELHGALVAFTLYEERVNDVVVLVRYCYDNLVPEALREMITLYAVCKIEKLWVSEEFQGLVEAHGELSRSLIGFMVKAL